jgi:hypothetical protein
MEYHILTELPRQNGLFNYNFLPGNLYEFYTQVHNYLKLNSITVQSFYYGYDQCLGHTAVQLVEGLRYRREGRRFDTDDVIEIIH